MAINETVGVKVKADTDQARRSFESLRGGVEKFRDSATKSMSSFGDSITKINQGLELGQKVLGAFSKAMDVAAFASDMRQLERVVDQTFVQKLGKALGGTVDQLSIMQIAAKNWGSVTAEQMELVFKAADELSHRGFGETTRLAEQLFEKIRQGETTELRKFGLALDATGTRAQKITELFGELNDVVADPVAFDKGTENFQQFQTAITNMVNGAKDALGGFFVETLAFFREFRSEWEATKSFFNDVRAFWNEQTDFLANRNGNTTTRQAGAGRIARGLARDQAIREGRLAQPGYVEGLTEQYMRLNSSALLDTAEERFGPRAAGADRSMQQAFVELTAQIGRISVAAEKAAEAAAEAVGPTGNAFSGPAGKGKGTKSNPIIVELSTPTLEQMRRIRGEAEARRSGGVFFQDGVDLGLGLNVGVPGLYTPPARERGPRLSKGMKGALGAGGAPLGQGDLISLGEGLGVSTFEQQFGMRFDDIVLASEALGGLESAIGAATDAAITGNQAIGQAFAQMTAQVLKSIAVQAQVKAAFQFAEGIALSFTAPAAAPAAFAAAAAYQGVAVLAGGLAAATGKASGAFGGGKGGGTAPVVPTSGSGGGGGSVYNITINSTYGDRKEIGQSIQRAMRESERAGLADSGTQTFVRGN